MERVQSKVVVYRFLISESYFNKKIENIYHGTFPYKYGRKNMFVTGICRPLNTPLADFTQLYTNMLEYTNNCRPVFVGDFNMDVLGNSNATRNYVDTLHQYGLINEINLPTYVPPSTGIATSSIDHLWHNLDCSRRSYVVSPALTDHYAICVILRINHDSPPKSIRF